MCIKCMYNVISNAKIDFLRVLVNSKFGVFYSNFFSLTPTYCKVSIEKYSKTPTFSGRHHFHLYFQNPSDNSVSEILAQYLFSVGRNLEGLLGKMVS